MGGWPRSSHRSVGVPNAFFKSTRWLAIGVYAGLGLGLLVGVVQFAQAGRGASATQRVEAVALVVWSWPWPWCWRGGDVADDRRCSMGVNALVGAGLGFPLVFLSDRTSPLIQAALLIALCGGGLVVIYSVRQNLYTNPQAMAQLRERGY